MDKELHNKIEKLDDKIDKLISNDLVHIYDRLGSVEGKQSILVMIGTGLLVAALGLLFK